LRLIASLFLATHPDKRLNRGALKKIFATLALCLGLTASPVMAAPLTKLTVMLEWFVNPDHAPLIVAQEKGYFKAEGLEVSIVAPADPNDSPKLVAAGKADLAVDYQPHLYLQASQGLP
jgi:putative hydroxymethylpyrimidine transport system substrate-binding protein